jgi:hypothetical protein
MGAAPCTCKQREPIATQHVLRGLCLTSLASRLQHNMFYAACVSLAWQADCITTCSTRLVLSLPGKPFATQQILRGLSNASLWQADCNTTFSTRLALRLPGKLIATQHVLRGLSHASLASRLQQLAGHKHFATASFRRRVTFAVLMF